MHHWLVAVGTPRKNKQQTHPLMSRPFLTFLSLSKSPVSAEQVTSDHPLSLFSFFQYPLLNFPTVYSIPKPPFPPLFLFIINNRHSINIQLGSFFCFLGEKVVFLTKMGSISFVNSQTLKLFPSFNSFLHSKQPCIVSMYHYSHKVALAPSLSLPKPKDGSFRLAAGLITNSVPSRNGNYTVGDFMTRKEDLHVVKTTTSVDEALEALVEKRVTGFPVIDDDWNLVGVVSDYDLLALDSISGSSQNDTTLFPNVDSSWKTFNEIQKLMNKNNGKVVGDLMTPSPLVVRETTNLEDAARLLLETKYRRLPVVDIDGKLVGIITRGNVVRATLQIKHSIES